MRRIASNCWRTVNKKMEGTLMGISHPHILALSFAVYIVVKYTYVFKGNEQATQRKQPNIFKQLVTPQSVHIDNIPSEKSNFNSEIKFECSLIHGIVYSGHRFKFKWVRFVMEIYITLILNIHAIFTIHFTKCNFY